MSLNFLVCLQFVIVVLTDHTHLDVSIANGTVSSKINDKQDDFNFEIVNFSFVDRDVPRSLFYSVSI